MNAPTRPVAAVLLMVLVIGACSSSAKPATPPKPVDYGRQYLRIVAPGNVAIQTFQARAGALSPSATIADVSKLTTALADSMDATSQRLLRATWPANARQDIKDLVAAVEVVIADLHDVSSQTLSTMGTWKSHLTGDLGRASGHVAAVRADLGLPPAKQSTASPDLVA